eukprot:TRINITY_DN99200_c0_g1_i1.p1 TRINITY_DN99200_c0_g1~~TRINITY_DN99200_c0_g1_i1.p1  ORF type:complete len:303 (-),score=75.81 TRINITY_DN99200_c0_g1_i1:54-962(-)
MNSEDLRALQHSQSEGYVEYSADGRVLKARQCLHQTSKYQEDELIGEHSSVWGSYFEISTGRWGFKCCKQCVQTDKCIPLKKPSQCTNSADDDGSPKQVNHKRHGPLFLDKGKQTITLQQVIQRLQGRDQCVHGLLASVTSLGSLCCSSAELMKEKLDKIEHQQQAARNLGEDLVEDTLVLDSLESLSAEERLARKAVLTDLETLASKVDGAKCSLLQLRCECEQVMAGADDEKTKKKSKKGKKVKEQSKKAKKAKRRKEKKKDRKNKKKASRSQGRHRKSAKKAKTAKKQSSSSSSSSSSD